MLDFSYRCCIDVYCVGDWIRERVEPPGVFQMTNEEKKILLARLVRSTRYSVYMFNMQHTHTYSSLVNETVFSYSACGIQKNVV